VPKKSARRGDERIDTTGWLSHPPDHPLLCRVQSHQGRKGNRSFVFLDLSRQQHVALLSNSLGKRLFTAKHHNSHLCGRNNDGVTTRSRTHNFCAEEAEFKNALMRVPAGRNIRLKSMVGGTYDALHQSATSDDGTVPTALLNKIK
jgi:hypothetical protein